jgi:1-acyl-sn-glycerol-3-phosphate acyltransferase
VSRLRPAVVLLAFACLTLPLMPLQQLFVWAWPRAARAFPMYYHRVVLRILGVRLRKVGRPLVIGPALLVSNHVSWLDIVVLSALAPVSFVAKREVHGWPFFGTLARLQRTVFIDRNRRHSTGDARDELRERLRAGDILVLFAEGTSGDGVRVLPFKSSFFSAAEATGATVQPISLVYSGHWGLPMNRRTRPLYAWYGDMDLGPHLWEALAAGPIEVTAVCHPPLPDGNSRKSLAREAEQRVRNGLVSTLAGRGVPTHAEMS